MIFLLNFNNIFNNDILTHILIVNCYTVLNSGNSEPIFKRKPSTYTPTANLNTFSSKQQIGSPYSKTNGNVFVHLNSSNFNILIYIGILQRTKIL